MKKIVLIFSFFALALGLLPSEQNNGNYSGISAAYAQASSSGSGSSGSGSNSSSNCPECWAPGQRR